ncbi:MAG: Fur family transcriptional regulator [Bradymonadia bacterium]
MQITSQRYEELRGLIRDAGLRATRGRIIVYMCLEHAQTPLSHGDLVEQLVPQGFDRATIYRNLTDLTQSGLVRRIDVGDHTWRFELMGDDEHDHHDHAEGHPHFVCVDCGQVQCLDGVKLTVSSAAAPRAVHSQQVQIHLRGVCDACI